MGSDSLRNRNIALFKARFPDVWAHLSALSETASTLIKIKGKARNIGLDDENALYQHDAIAETNAQLEDYFAKPDRLGFADARHLNMSNVSKAAHRTLLDSIDEQTREAMATYPVSEIGWCFIFGVGLGYHLPPLVQRTRAHIIVIIEPIYEFILHSLSSIDWVALVEDADANDQTLVFVLEDDPEQALARVQSMFNAMGATFFDGSYAYLHYPSWGLRKCREILNEKIALYENSRGFFEDEIIMVTHAYLNLTNKKIHLVQNEPRPKQKTPVFLIGSGPSLDDALPVIEEWKDKAVIISCGTALGVLLKNKIRPHIHVENENTLPLVKNLQNWQTDYGLDGIQLVASTTVSPEAPKLFGSAWFYFREPLSATRLLAPPGEAFIRAAPLVANAGLVIAASLGFNEIYLFGVDCGRKISGKHHAQDAVYYDEGYDQMQPGSDPARLETGFDQTRPGNFGGEVETSLLYDASRANLVGEQKSTQVKLINCADGARIEGATPRHPDALDFSGVDPNPNHDKILAKIQESLTLFDPGAFDFASYANMCDRLEALLQSEMAAARENDRSFWDFEQRFRLFIAKHHRQIEGPWALMAPSVATLIRMGAFLGSRITDEAERHAFFSRFLGVFHERLLHMNERCRALFSDMNAGTVAPLTPEAPALLTGGQGEAEPPSLGDKN